MHPLDRPVWTALTTRLAAFAAGDARARRFLPEIGPLCAAADGSPEALDALMALAAEGEELSLLEAAPPAPPPGVVETLRATCLQMIAPKIAAGASNAAIEPLGDADAAGMLELALLTRPGPFREKTHRLGRFLGIRDGARLVAMAGERMQADGFIEISAVCTHPDYRGRGLGAALMRAVGDRILSDGATPFLHTYATNTPAIALYRALGFETRAEVLHAAWKRA